MDSADKGTKATADRPAVLPARRSERAGRGLTLCMINRDGERYLPESLRAATVLSDQFTEIVVIDDASEDGSARLVRERFPAVRVVELGENVGPAAARNAALREARTDLVLLLDNDVSVAPGCVELLVEALDEHAAAAVAMPSVIYADRPDVVQFNGADCHFLGHQILRGVDTAPAAAEPGAVPVGSLVTACCLVDTRRLPRDAAFDDTFFIYFEDHDLGLRLRGQGRQILSVPRARCLHGAGSVGLSIRSLGRYSSRRVLYLIRNRWQLVLKTYSSRTLLLLAPLFAFYELAQLVTVVRQGWLREWVAAARWIAGHAREIRRRRERYQRARTVPDRELLEGGPIPFRAELAQGGVDRLGKRVLDVVATSYWRAVRPLI